MGNQTANLLNGICISQNSFSKSHSQHSLRFTCCNGHNFFLSTDSLIQTHTLLTNHLKNGNSTIDQTILNQLNWCSKCINFERKVKSLENLKKISVVSGLFTKSLNLQCHKKGHLFSIPYTKKLEHINCTRCKNDDIELHKLRLKQQEAFKAEQSRINQEILFAQAKQNMMQNQTMNPLCKKCNYLSLNCLCKQKQ